MALHAAASNPGNTYNDFMMPQVKKRFSDRPQIYNLFLDIMKKFKAQT